MGLMWRLALIAALIAPSGALARVEGCESVSPIPAAKREAFYPALVPFLARLGGTDPLLASPLCPVELLSLLDAHGIALVKSAGQDPEVLMRRLEAVMVAGDGALTPAKPASNPEPKPQLKPAPKPTPAKALPNWESLPRGERGHLGPPRAAAGDLIPDRYFVLLDAERIRALGVTAGGIDANTIVALLGLRHLNVGRVYSAGFAGFLLNGAPELADRLQVNPLVAGVSQDRMMHSMRAAGHSAALDRIDQAFPELDQAFQRPAETRDVRAYLIDTGIREDHEELAGKIAMWRGVAANLAGDAESACNSHGTAMASLIGGRTLGVADRVRLVDVVIAPCKPGQNLFDPVTFPASALLDAISWIAGQEGMRSTQPGFVPAVVNMSVGTQADWVTRGDIRLAQRGAFEQALRGFIQSTGAIVVAAAGNESADACRIFPAHMPEVITVGGATAAGGLAAFSNFGACVNAFAPGENQTTASAVDRSAWQVENGTSGAAALVSGIAAHRLARGEARGKVVQALTDRSASAAQIAAVMQGLLGQAATRDRPREGMALSLPMATILPGFTCAVRSPDGVLAMRMAADFTSGKISDLPNGTRFRVLQRQGRWALIQPEGEPRQGWSAMSAKAGQLAVSLATGGPC